MRAIFNVGKKQGTKYFNITPKRGPNTTRQSFTSHLCSKTAFCLSSLLYLRGLRPEILKEFPIFSPYVRSSMKWHTVPISKPRGS
mgnify:CR=1 FL=1